jgi:hypothetical protein
LNSNIGPRWEREWARTRGDELGWPSNASARRGPTDRVGSTCQRLFKTKAVWTKVRRRIRIEIDGRGSSSTVARARVTAARLWGRKVTWAPARLGEGVQRRCRGRGSERWSRGKLGWRQSSSSRRYWRGGRRCNWSNSGGNVDGRGFEEAQKGVWETKACSIRPGACSFYSGAR